MFLLLFNYDSVIISLKLNWNTPLFFILRYLYGSKDDYVTNKLLIEAKIRSNKRKLIEKLSQGVSIRTWMREVRKYGYVLGNIKTKTSTIPRENSRSTLKAKLASLEMRAHPKNADIEEILADILRCEQNRNLTDK